MNPLVSFGIITYNQEQFILDTLKGAVSQEYDNMEIIVSDDNSTDKTFELSVPKAKTVFNLTDHKKKVEEDVLKVSPRTTVVLEVR